MAEFYVEQQGWAHWPKVLIMCRKNGRDVTRRRYVPEVETGEGMSITDELRKVAAKTECANGRCEKLYRGDLERIADRIDAEHEMETSEFWAKINAVPATDENMAEHGWVRLPKDADGEYIHIGDMMAYADNTKPMAVMALVPPAVFLTEDGPRYADMCRHYHAPTVEDVLREFGDKYCDVSLGSDAESELFAEYAAKLRLADDGKEQ